MDLTPTSPFTQAGLPDLGLPEEGCHSLHNLLVMWSFGTVSPELLNFLALLSPLIPNLSFSKNFLLSFCFHLQ